ncbi:MAG TPA: SDR family NAD(P)-dependent oxidoreductase, partial [Devosia sp.]
MSESKEWAGKVALVTGGGSGIGAAAARMIAAKGATVALLDVVEASVSKVHDEIVAAGGKAFMLLADVGDEAQMKAAYEAIAVKEGRIDMMVVSAGINGTWAPVDDMTPEEFDRTIRINLRGTYLSFHYGVPLLKKAGGGSIVVISSMNGQRVVSTAGASAYSATKAAQAAMARQLALELSGARIRVNSIFPGATETNIGQNTWRRNVEDIRIKVEFAGGDVPITGGKRAKAEDVAEGIVFLCSDAARHITGAELNIDGGQSLIR